MNEINVHFLHDSLFVSKCFVRILRVAVTAGVFIDPYIEMSSGSVPAPYKIMNVLRFPQNLSLLAQS